MNKIYKMINAKFDSARSANSVLRFITERSHAGKLFAFE